MFSGSKGSGAGFVLVDLMPCWSNFIWPFAVAVEWGVCFMNECLVSPGKLVRKLLLMAWSTVVWMALGRIELHDCRLQCQLECHWQCWLPVELLVYLVLGRDTLMGLGARGCLWSWNGGQ